MVHVTLDLRYTEVLYLGVIRFSCSGVKRKLALRFMNYFFIIFGSVVNKIEHDMSVGLFKNKFIFKKT